MLFIPQKGKWQVQHNLGSVGDTTPGAAVVTHATVPSTKGTPVELIASTNFDVCLVHIIISNFQGSAGNGQGLMDLMVGAATEHIIWPNMMVGNAGGVSGTNGPKHFIMPLYIPSGVRVAAQLAGARLAATAQVSIILRGGLVSPAFRVGSEVTTYGIGTVPAGTAITPGASGAEGAWTEIVASSSHDHFAFLPGFQCSDTTMNSRGISVDIGIGAATEEEIGSAYTFGTSGTEDIGSTGELFPAMQDVPSGTRLVLRASNSGTNDASYDCCIHALRA